MHRILCVDDDLTIQRLVRIILERNGYHYRPAFTAGDAISAHAEQRPDLILLDLGLPDMDGTEVIRHIRESATTPIIVMSMRGAEQVKVRALDLGADDYVNKPFGVDELLARVRAALRRKEYSPRQATTVVRRGDLEVDLDSRRVTVAGQDIRLTNTEYKLLTVFVAHSNKVLTHSMLLHQVWGEVYGPESSHYLHVYVSNLRKKLGSTPQGPQYLCTEPRVGYRLRVAEA